MEQAAEDKITGFKLAYLNRFLITPASSNPPFREISQQIRELQRDIPGSNPEQIDTLYYDVRREEKKLPSMVLFQEGLYPRCRKTPYASDTSWDRLFEFAVGEPHPTIYFLGCPIAHFGIRQPEKHEPPFLEGIIFEDDFSTYFSVDPSFFQGIDPPKAADSRSDVRNIAKSFVKVNSNNFAALLQYLAPHRESTEHYHSLPERIIQIGGKSHVELRSLDNETPLLRKSLQTGDDLIIPPFTRHRIYTGENTSITLAYKQTLRRRTDHFFQPKSPQRIQQTIESLLLGTHHGSGDSIITSLQDYLLKLTPAENIIAREILLDISGKRLKEQLFQSIADLMLPS